MDNDLILQIAVIVGGFGVQWGILQSGFKSIRENVSDLKSGMKEMVDSAQQSRVDCERRHGELNKEFIPRTECQVVSGALDEKITHIGLKADAAHHRIDSIVSGSPDSDNWRSGK